MSAGGGDRVVESTLHGEVVYLRIFALARLGRHAVDELRDRELLCVERCQFESQRLTFVVVNEDHVDGGAPIEIFAAQPVFHNIVDVEVEPAHDLDHQASRLKDDDFIIDIAAGRGSQQVAEGGQIGLVALLSVLNEDGCGAIVDLRCRVDVKKCARQADDRRKQEPEPVADDHLKQIVQRKTGDIFRTVGRRTGCIAILFHVLPDDSS